MNCRSCKYLSFVNNELIVYSATTIAYACMSHPSLNHFEVMTKHSPSIHIPADDMQIRKSLKSPDPASALFVKKKVIFQLEHLNISPR